MNPRLKESVETAESVLPQDGQNRLANIVEAFTANYQQDGQSVFSEAEIAEMREMEKEGFIEGDSAKAEVLFSKHGL